MNRHFPTNDVIERAPRNSSDSSVLRVGIVLQSFQEAPIRPGRPLHPRLIGLGAVLLVAVLVTDVTYAITLLFQWENFSIWLLTGGLVLAALGGVTLVLDILSRRVAHIEWVKFTGLAVAAMLSLLNAFVHSRDAYTAVVPQGIVLSASVATLLVFIGWWGWNVGTPSSSH
ncbi:MAG TPA: DUF2231 domain-containing protein [Rhizomicrobium sp.]|nr:DUF2231 domain-containing protein [Rhizomicrobium sp.]